MNHAAPPARRSGVWPIALGVISLLYSLVGMCGGMTAFTASAFSPIIASEGGERPPIAPIELRWHSALEAIFVFALAVLLCCASTLLVRERRQGALMIGLWAGASLFVHAIFLAWAFTLVDERRAYAALVDAWRQRAMDAGFADARPFGSYTEVIDATIEGAKWVFAIPFIYPALVGVFLVTPPVRRQIAGWA